VALACRSTSADGTDFAMLGVVELQYFIDAYTGMRDGTNNNNCYHVIWPFLEQWLAGEY
jgi:hypothetical protein